MRAIVRVFLTLPIKSVWVSLTDKKLPVGKLFIYVQRSFTENLELLSWKIREYGITGLNGIFYVCPENFKSFHTIFAEKWRVKYKKKNTFSPRKNVVLLLFIGKNNKWTKKFYQEEKSGLKCSILIYIYLLNWKNFFSNLHFDRVDNTSTYFRERGEFYDPGAQLKLKIAIENRN